jgi:hypothetical protein
MVSLSLSLLLDRRQLQNMGVAGTLSPAIGKLRRLRNL